MQADVDRDPQHSEHLFRLFKGRQKDWKKDRKAGAYTGGGGGGYLLVLCAE